MGQRLHYDDLNTLLFVLSVTAGDTTHTHYTTSKTDFQEGMSKLNGTLGKPQTALSSPKGRGYPCTPFHFIDKKTKNMI